VNFRRKLKQFAVYWAPGGDNNAGQEVYEFPVEIRVRWEINLIEIIGPTGQTWMSKTQVYHTDDRVKQDGYLWLGKFTELTDETDPRNNEDAARVMQIERVPSRKATQELRCAYL
jgi:hypothetical protein